MSATKPQPVPAASESDLPEGWALSPLREVCQINPPKVPPDSLEPDQPVTFVPMPAVDADRGAITAPQERAFSEVRRGFTSFQDEDVIMAKITPCMENGKAAIARGLVNGLGFGSTEFHVLRSNGAVLPEFVYHLIRQESFRRAAEAEMTGSVGQKRVPLAFLGQVELPLSPLAEQKRIIEKVEQLLARVNAARERLARVHAILKRFRQSVLAAACSGRLTTDWREQHPKAAIEPDLLKELPRRKKKRAGRLWGAGVVPELTEDERDSLPETWRWVKVREVGTYPDDTVQVGPMSMRSKDFAERGVPVLNVGCVQWGWFDESKLDYMPEEIAKHFERYRIAANDILFTRSGTVGRCAVASDRQHGSLMTFHLLRVRPDSKRCLPLFLQFVFQGATHIKRQTEEAAIGSTRAGFNTNLLAGLDVPLPPLDEQQEIVRRVEDLFKLAHTTEERMAGATARAEKLTQAILAKAFRGELVPTEAELARREGRSYEPAPVLLARIRAERRGRDSRRGRQRVGS